MIRRQAFRCVLLLTVAAISLCAIAATPSPAQAKITVEELSAAKSIGSKSAPIMIEDFSDFQCPTCKYFFMTAMRQVIDEYVASGKVFVVHHDFPLPMHAHSHEAAQWANAAALTGKFQEVETALYSKQESWEATGNIEEVVATVLTPAEMRRTRLLINNPEIEAGIQHDIDLGHQKNVTGTPSIFVTHKGKTVELPPGGVSYPILKKYLDYLLTQ